MNDMGEGKGFLRGVGLTLLWALVVRGPAVAQQPQQIQVSGTVSGPAGEHLRGVTVRVRGSATSTVTDDNGKYSLSAPSDAVPTFGLIGFRGLGQNIGGRTTINVSMERAISVLPEVVVTGDQSQKRTDITRSGAALGLGNGTPQTSARVLHKLEGRAARAAVDARRSPR